MTAQHPRVSRRAALAAGGAGFGLLVAGQSQAGVAQESDVPTVVRTFVDGWEALDPDRITQTFAADGRREDITTPVVFEGHDEIQRSLAGFFAAFSNARVVHPQVLAGPDPYAADTWVFSGDYVGTLPGFPSGDGQSLTIHGFTLIELVNDTIARTVDYYDAAGLLVQIEGTPTATPVAEQGSDATS